MLKQLLGLDRLHWGFLFFGLAIAVLVFTLWYPELIGTVGWERGEYIDISSGIAKIISYLIVGFIVFLLLILGFWWLLERLSKNKKEFGRDQVAIIGVISLAVDVYILPTVIKVINAILGIAINIGVAILLLLVPLGAFLATMQLLRCVTFLSSRKGS